MSEKEKKIAVRTLSLIFRKGGLELWWRDNPGLVLAGQIGYEITPADATASGTFEESRYSSCLGEKKAPEVRDG